MKKKIKAAPVRKMGPKPHIRMQKLRPIPGGAFPTSAAAFPTDPNPASPDSALDAQPGGMPTGAAGGTMGD